MSTQEECVNSCSEVMYLKYYCKDCGELIGDDTKELVIYYETENGEPICSNCYFKRIDARQQKRDKKLKKIYSMGFRDIPFDVFKYCTQNIFQDTCVRKIPIDDLSKYSTACGVVGNKPFTKSVIQFLKRYCAKEYVLAELMNETEIINMAVCWKDKPEKNSEKFADMVYANGGSLRPELEIEDGWDCYESE